MRLRDRIAAVLVALAGFAASDAAAAPAVVLSWEPMPGAGGYELEIATEPSFAAPIIATASDVPRYEWKTLPERVYYWRVRCRYSFGRRGEWSAVRTVPRAVFPVVLTSPKPDEELVCAEGCTVKLAFEKSPALAEYRLELTREADTDFVAPTLDVRVSGTGDGIVEWIPDDTGAYRWRVSAVDLLGRAVPANPSVRLVLSPPKPVVVATPEPSPSPVETPVVIAGPPIMDLAALLEQSIEPLEPATTPAPVDARPIRWSEPFAITTGAGWRSNFAAASDMTPVVSFTRPLTGPFAAGADVSSFRVAARSTGELRADASVAELALRAGIVKPLGPLEIGFHTGPVFQLVRARVGEAGEIGAALAAGGGMNVSGPLGSARWVLGADVRHGRWHGRYAEMSTGGALLSAGVRFR